MSGEASTEQPGTAGVAIQTAETDRTGPADRPSAKRLWAFAALVASGMGLMAVAYFAVYPKPATAIPIPASPSLVIYTSGHVAQITYQATTDAAGRPEMRITVSLGPIEMIGSTLTPVPVPAPAPGSSSLEVTLPPALAFRDCGAACVKYAGETAWLQPLDFHQRTATDVFPIKTAGFGTDVSSVYAYAAIPQISFASSTPQQNAASEGRALFPTLRAEYRISAPGSYDWSTGPVPAVTRSSATWEEVLPTTNVAGETAAGVNHGQQTDDADYTFLAGFLLGLAGSIVLVGIQLLLPSPVRSRSHTNDPLTATAAK